MMKCNVHTIGIRMLSFTLALQRSNGTYKNISHPYSRIRSSLNRNVMFSFKCFKALTIIVPTMWFLNLLLLCGDIHVSRARCNEKELKAKPATSFKYFQYLLTKKIKTKFKTEKILFDSTLVPQNLSQNNPFKCL